MLRLENISAAITIFQINDEYIKTDSYALKRLSGSSRQGLENVVLKKKEVQETLYKQLEETYMENLTMEKVLKDLQR